VEAALKSLPHNLPDTYIRILERIEAQPQYMRDLALNCLTWTIYARRPLSTEELQHALAIDSKCTAQQDLQLDSPQVILEACGNLLEETNGSIRPIHYTVQEFFTPTVHRMPQHTIRVQLLDSHSAHRQMGLACLAYIQIMAFGEPASNNYVLYMRIRGDPFASYACQSFDYHISNCDGTPPDIIDRLERLLRQEQTNLAALLQIKVLRDGQDYSNVIQRFNDMNILVSPSTIVYSTSLYNIPNIRQRWVDQTPPTHALHLAASAGLNSAVIRLLEGGYDIDEKDRSGSTSLYYSCLNGDLDILQILIGKDADVNAQGGHFGSALQAASTVGHEQIVKLLLDKGADVNAQGGEFGSALQAASAGGYEQIVKLLLDKGADVNAQGEDYGSALQAASEGGHEQIVKLLLDKGAENAHGGLDINAF